MLADHWPTYGLRVETERLRLRLPDDGELAALASLAAEGVHEPGERPFLTPWTEGGPDERAREVLRGHWADLAGWRPDRWALGLGVFTPDGEPLGQVTLRGDDFGVVREVRTSSWLGLRHHRRGYGTEARTAVLALAFDHLGARSALSEVFPDNHASQGVSRRLGYEPDGVSWDARDGEALRSDRLRLTRERWLADEHPDVRVARLDACRDWFIG
ncbi:GNAT family N-acetyltransferase [Angustibacter aerolatus]